MTIVAHADHITNEMIYSDKFNKSFSSLHIFFIADVHRRKINSATLEKVKEPIDLVLIGGDVIERNVPFKKLRDNIIKLKKWNKPIYFVWGNNDYEVDTEKLISLLKSEKVIILKDEIVNIYKNNEKINLIGFDYYKDLNVQPSINWQEVDAAFTLVLTHQPSAYYKLHESEKDKIDLMLAGHTHGGQIRIFGFGFYENGGIRYDKETTLFVTEGYGYTLLPFRLQTKAQCHVISLVHK